MSQQAKEYIEEGENHRKAGRNSEALAKYNQAIALFKQSSNNLTRDDFFTLQTLAEKLIYNLTYREESLIVLDLCDKCQGIDDALRAGVNLNRGNAYLALDKIDEARAAFIKSSQQNSAYPESYAMAGSLSEDIGSKDVALKYYDMGLAKNPKDYKNLLLKGNLLSDMGKYDEAIALYEDILSRQPNDSLTNYRKAAVHIALRQHDKAKACYEKGAQMQPNTSASWAAKGQCLSMIGKSDEAMEVFKKAQNILETNKTSISAPWFVNSTKAALKAVLESEETAKKVQAEVSNLDQNNPVVKKFIKNIQNLQEKKVITQNKVLDLAGKKQDGSATQNLAQLDQIKEDFQRELAALKAEMAGFKTEVRTEIKNIHNNMEAMKEELNSKMDDFHKKLDIELNKQDLSEDGKRKLKAYFVAFIGTFSSAHVSAQVVDSGMVQLDTGSNVASVLSFMASFAPFVGSALESGINSISDFLETKEMKTNARLLKGLAPDAVALSQVIGKTGFGILMDKKKQKQILMMTDQELNKINGNAFQKVFEFCKQVSEKIDVFLYTQMYKTAPERLGHNDANELIELWTSGKVMPYTIEEQFIEHTLKSLNEQATQGQNSPQELKRSADNRNGSCCNMF